jgi:hypothetical protein
VGMVVVGRDVTMEKAVIQWLEEGTNQPEFS